MTVTDLIELDAYVQKNLLMTDEEVNTMLNQNLIKQKPGTTPPATAPVSGAKTPAQDEPRMTRAEHWAAINAERAAKKEAEEKARNATRSPVPRRPTNPMNPGPKTGPFGNSLLKSK